MFALLSFLTYAQAADLSVSSNIKGLSIVIDGNDTGLRTPAVVHDLSPGTVLVQVGDNCRAGEATVELEEGSNKVSVRAEDALATLTVQVTPAQAVVDVNHGKVKLSPNVPVGLPCGTYEIAASLKGYEPTGYTLELIGGQDLTLPIELEKLGMSTVELSVEPRSASLLFDGKEVGKDAASLPSVYAGLHTIGASAKGYTPVEVPIQVGDGDDLVFKIELGRGDMDGDVTAVGGAGKVALQNGAKANPKKTSSSKAAARAEEEDEDLPEDEPEDDEGTPDEEEPDADLAPKKSWSEMHAEEAKKETTKPRRSSSLDDLDEPAKPKAGKAGLKAAGGVLVGLGAVVGGGGGLYMWTQANDAYATWETKQSAADNASETEKRHLQQVADAYWTDEFAPKGNLMYGLFGAGGVLAATGVVLLVIDADAAPILVPAPGGGMVGWTGSF